MKNIEIIKKSIRNIFKENIPFSIVNGACNYQYEKYKKLNMYITRLDNVDDSKIEFGIPMSVKDVFLTKNIKTTAASKMLNNFISPYTATVVDRLEKNNFINNGKTNLDEFAMGSSGVTSYFGPTINFWKTNDGLELCPGGSSSGSVVSVGTGSAFVSICSDTSGSIRLPSSWTCTVGFKPTYGVLSRYGMLPLAESLDHPGLCTRIVDDIRYTFEKMIGKDKNDLTSVNYKEHRSNKKRFGIIKEIHHVDGGNIDKKINEVEKIFESLGYKKEIYSIPEIDLCIPTYVVLCRAECGSNLQRYDGMRFGLHNLQEDLEKQYINTRTEGFGIEVQRRILTGGFVTSSENIREYVEKAQKLRQLIKEKIKKLMEEVDFIIMATGTGGMTLQEATNTNLQDPIKMQKCDLYTVIANLCGFPAISVPVGFDERGSPFGIDIMGAPFQDLQIMDYGEILEKHFKMNEELIKKITGEEN